MFKIPDPAAPAAQEDRLEIVLANRAIPKSAFSLHLDVCRWALACTPLFAPDCRLHPT